MQITIPTQTTKEILPAEILQTEILIPTTAPTIPKTAASKKRSGEN